MKQAIDAAKWDEHFYPGQVNPNIFDLAGQKPKEREINIEEYLKEVGRAKLNIHEFTFYGHRVVFKKPLVISIYLAKENMYVNNEIFHIWGIAKSIREALDDFMESFLNVYLTYRDANNRNHGAEEYFKKLKSIIKFYESNQNSTRYSIS